MRAVRVDARSSGGAQGSKNRRVSGGGEAPFCLGVDWSAGACGGKQNSRHALVLGSEMGIRGKHVSREMQFPATGRQLDGFIARNVRASFEHRAARDRRSAD